MAERRAHPRHRTLKAGKIVFNHHFSVVDCTVRSLSATGARLDVPSTFGIPDDFDLLVERFFATDRHSVPKGMVEVIQ